MKVKIIGQPHWSNNLAKVDLEDLINDFIQDKKVIDIKYQSSASDYERTALIMYEDKKETADKPVVEKLKEEKADLDEKIRKFKTFLNDDEKLSNIGKVQADLLKRQLEVMQKYHDFLLARIYDLGELGNVKRV